MSANRTVESVVRSQISLSADDLQRLRERWQSWYAKQAAHAHSAANNSRWDGLMLILVVIISTIVGSGFIASIGKNPATWVKISLGLLGLLAALLAALKEKVPFAKYSRLHATAEEGFEELRYGVEELADRWRHGDIEYRQVILELHGLENRAEQLDKNAPQLSNRQIRRAVRSITKMRNKRKKLSNALFQERAARPALLDYPEPPAGPADRSALRNGW